MRRAIAARQTPIQLGIRLGREAGQSNSQIVAEPKMRRYFADRYFRWARRVSNERLTQTFKHLAALEYALKGGKADPAIGLDLLVGRLSA